MEQKKFTTRKYWDTVIIGGGQAGLAVGYYLKKQQENFVIIESGNRIGDSWRSRWDSLCLFTPARYDGLPGSPFPASGNSFPGREEMADYLEEYAKKFDLPVLTGVRVDHISAKHCVFEITTSGEICMANRVIVATGTNPVPKIPDFSEKIDGNIFQIHSSQYRNPGSIPPGDVLVVGAGTSGVEISLELSRSRHTVISGKPSFHIPDPVLKYTGGLYWWFASNILTIRTPIGRKARNSIIHGSAPLIRVSAKELDAAGIERLPRVTGTENGLPRLANGRTVKVSSIIWATGYKPDFTWIEPKITDDSGWPKSSRGVSTIMDELYFIGMPFQYGLTSGLIGGVNRDASYLMKRINAARP